MNDLPGLDNLESLNFDQVQSQIPVQKSFSFDLPGGFVFQPNVLQAGAIILLIFLLVLTLGSLRHRMNHWQMKGVIPGIMFGFVMALIIEGLFIVAGKTILVSVLGWEKPPKPVEIALDSGRNKLINVLGVSDKNVVEDSKISSEEILDAFSELSPTEKDSIKSLICTEE